MAGVGDLVDGEVGRQLGRLEGNVEALSDRVGAVSENLRELRTENARDHAAVVRTLEEIRGGLQRKADTTRVNDHASRIDSLEKTRDEQRGAEARDTRHERRASLYLAALSVLGGIAIGVLSVLAATGNLS